MSNLLPETSGNTAEINGLRMFFEDRSSTDPTGVIVFVHGYPLNHSLWRNQLDFFSITHRCIAPDLRGYGGSQHLDAPLPPEQWTMDVFAEDVVALMDHLGVERATICGLSMGGYIAFALWRKHRKRVHRLILADTKATADSDEAKANRYKQMDLVKDKGAPALADAMLPKLIVPANMQAVGLEVRRMVESTPVDTIVGSLFALAERPDSSTTLAEITVPTLVVVGAEDQITPVSDADFIRDYIDSAGPLAVIPSAGHLSPLENPTAFNQALAGFLNH